MAVQVQGGRAVVISRHWVGDQTGVAVSVHYTSRWDVHLGGITDGHMLLEHAVQGVEKDDEVRQPHTVPILDVGIGQQATLPEACVGIFPALVGQALHHVGELTAAAHKQNDALAVSNMSSKIQHQPEMLQRLVQIDDILVQTASKDVWLHQPVTASFLVTEMDTGIKQCLHREELLHIKEVGVL